MKKIISSLCACTLIVLTGCDSRPRDVTFTDSKTTLANAQAKEATLSQHHAQITTNAEVNGFIGQGILGVIFNLEQTATLDDRFVAPDRIYRETDSTTVRMGSNRPLDYQDEVLDYYFRDGQGYANYTFAPNDKPDLLTPNKLKTELDINTRINQFLSTVFLSDFDTYYQMLLDEGSDYDQVEALKIYRLQKETYFEISLDNDQFAELLTLRGQTTWEFEVPGFAFSVTDFDFSVFKMNLIIDKENRGRLLTSEIIGRISVSYLLEGTGELNTTLTGDIDLDLAGSYTRTSFSGSLPLSFPADLSSYSS